MTVYNKCLLENYTHENILHKLRHTTRESEGYSLQGKNMATLKIIKEKFNKNGSTYPRSKIIIEETGVLLDNVSSWKITENGTKLIIELFGFSIEEVDLFKED